MSAVGVGMYLQEAQAQVGSVTRQPLARGNPGSNHPPACPRTERRNPQSALLSHKPLGALEKLEEQERNPGGKEEFNLPPRVSYFLLPSLPRDTSQRHPGDARIWQPELQGPACPSFPLSR